eukprot:Hpha_TRINITY_DN26358_c0_g1::TRINITY_DN26358_c0_g1_i2::g.9396::m.9396
MFAALAALTLTDEPGPAACLNLTRLLGKNVVAGNNTKAYSDSQKQYWNAMQSSYSPSCVVYPTSAQDVSTALQAARAAGSRFAVKTRGHNPNTFFSSVQDGVLIDLTSMTLRTYDPTTTLGTFQPGGTFGDIYEFYAQYNRTVVGARLADVGTGLALGGGLSYLSSQYGLACDSFRELEVVLPNGAIVTASPTQNADLFFACRGGGGNAYGVVTRYTVQTRPSGTFYAGNVIYMAEQTHAVMAAIENFTMYNTDPRAAIIGTYEKTPTPSLGIDLDEFAILFLVYDGPDAGGVFDNFTNIPHVLKTLKQRSYLDVVKLPSPDIDLTDLARGNNVFRVKVHRIGGAATYKAVYAAWKEWCKANKDVYALSSIDFQPVPASLAAASAAQNGGNAMQMPGGPWLWLNFLITTKKHLTPDEYDAAQASFRDMVNSIPDDPGLPLFINDANADQNPLKTFSTYETLKATKMKYDPDGFFSNFTGGWRFD